MRSKKRKILVTGGAGFIGSHVCDLLIDNGYRVFVFDNLSTGKKSYVNKKADFKHIDITNFKKVNENIVKIKPDYVLHLAAWPRIERSMDDPIGTNKANVVGTLSVLEAARLAGIQRFVYSSSSSVYGKQKDFKMVESMEPKPISHYALQKLIGEKYCSYYAENFGMTIFSLRYFSVYGDRQPSSGPYALVIGKFIAQKKNGKKLTIYGNGNQTRDFTNVNDVAKANLLAITKKVKTGNNYVLNIGTGMETSVNDIAKMIDWKVEHIIPNPRANFEEKRKVADIRMAKKILGWKPSVKLKDYLKTA